MASFKRTSLILLTSCAALALGACGASDIASPGEGNFPPTPTPSPTSTPTPTPTSPVLVTPAASCPTLPGTDQLVNAGTISGPTGEYRNCAFPARFTSNTQIPRTTGVIYSLPGRVDVGTDQLAASTGNNVTLTIDPGVVVFGATGVSFLAVNRGNRIDAVGTPTRPIIFTGRGNVTGAATDDTSQLWGGVVLLGRAPITDCLAPLATPGTTACERDTEGTSNALYGGATPADNSGRMQYVQIRYSGFILSAASELQGLTPSGVGSDTVIDHIQVHNSSDDGIEVFGGRVNMKYLVLTGNEDDNLDTDVGYKGFIQYVIAVQRAGVGDAMIEADSDNTLEENTPRQNTRLANFTFVQRSTTGADLAAILIRGSADYTLVNGVVSSPNLACLRISRANTLRAADPALDEAGPPRFESVSMSCPANPFLGNSGVTDAQVRATFEAGTNNISNLTSTLTNGYINGANETARPAFAAATLGSFFVSPGYVGAVKDATDTWYAGWTCNSATANFGATSAACTTLPTT
ncbi:hypothetical protein G4G27_09060 [Sphingomonas sp. So64.6b]|uniref:hypothetical protein n=1 Tax=Sphingomonas sp. So64.6b TaxID=2997354 RepID=UPI001600BE40|nr:hypothetical protein [Sphingomonas sp. So64.6b]QNA84119.1 hypothetical protein G4G27_09060 [Sphingomonas sp. So64.6b]